ncbi:MAG: flagellar hook-associated protein 2 [Candidatus Krumholzibacteriia bacterium]|jgi:flagellar hook-associated protein 2
MNGVSFSGLATGLDTGSIVSQLVELKRFPIYRLQNRKSQFEDQIKALSTFKTKLLALQTAAQNMDTASEFSALKSSTSDEDVITAKASKDAAPGSYIINVTQLATAQKDSSQGFDDKADSIGSGTLSFTVDGEATEIDLVGFTSLEGLATIINNDVDGVTASVIYDGSETGGYHLVMSSEEAGSGGAFTVDTSALTGGTTPTFTNDKVATDAILDIDGIAVVSTSNNPTDVISGLTLNLLKLGTSTITIERDNEAVAETVQALVDAYNDVTNFVTDNIGNEGSLRSNLAVRSVATRIDSIFTSELQDGLGDLSLIAQVGITRGEGRNLKFDKEDFDEALLDDFSSVRDLFIARDGNEGKTALLDDVIEQMTDSIDGLFKSSTDALNSKIKNADSSIERYERSIESYQMTLTRKFTAMENMVARLNAQGSYLSSLGY